MAECKACRGTGNCPKCGGKGKILGSSTLTSSRCPRCDGNCKCTVCNGKGKT